MTHIRLAALSLVCATSFCFCNCASAKVKYVYKSAAERRQDEKLKDQKQDVKKAQNEVKDEAKELSAAQQKLLQAQAKENETRHQLEVARQRVESEHKSSLGLDSALAEQTREQEALDAAKTPILQALKAKPEYQTAQERVAVAKARSKALRDGDESLSEEARQKALAETSRDKLAVKELEQAAIAAEPKLKPLRDNLANAQEKVAHLSAKLKEKVDADSEVQSGLKSLKNAMKQTALAKAEVAKESQELSGDQAKLSKEQAQFNNAKANDAKFVNTPRGKRPRTKKK